MDARTFARLLAPGCAAALLVTGCLSATGTENELTWGIKAATGRLTETTPGEWQAVANVIDQNVPSLDISLTDEQAQAIVDFVKANDLNSFPEIAQLVARAQSDPGVVEELEIPDSVMEFFERVEGGGEEVINDIIARAQP